LRYEHYRATQAEKRTQVQNLPPLRALWEHEMSDTPETDHLETELGQTALQAHPVIWKNSRKLERERNAAREQIRELIYIAERAIALAEIDFENDKFGVVSELREALMSVKMSTSK
jgi:hypothetical protein